MNTATGGAGRRGVESTRPGQGATHERPRATTLLAACLLLLGGCAIDTDPAPTTSGPAGPSTSAPTTACPEGSTPDAPGAADQARPDLSRATIPAAMQAAEGRVVVAAGEFVEGAGSATATSWTFDVCTNTWATDAADASAAPTGLLELVHHEALGMTWGLPAGRTPVWVLDTDGSGWTRNDAGGGGSSWWPLVAYDPDGGRVLAWEAEQGSVVSSLATPDGDWTVVPAIGAAPPASVELMMGQMAVTYDSAVDRLVLVLTSDGGTGPSGETWTFDTVAGTWERGQDVPNTLPGGYPEGWVAAFDAEQRRTVLFADTAMLAYDASADTWTAIERGSGWPPPVTVAGVEVDPTARTGHAMVYDPVNSRLVIIGGSVRPAGEPSGGEHGQAGRAIDDVWAYDLAANQWTQLLEPSEVPPSMGPG